VEGGGRAPLACGHPNPEEVRAVGATPNHDELTGLVHRVTDAARALIRGDVGGYLAQIEHAHDYALMSP
jgi:hypothetical protein